jgi:phospholipid/cholesterol/gamma-HCH transport system permease protein
MTSPLTPIFRAAAATVAFIGELGLLLMDAAAAVGPGLLRRRGRRVGWINLWAQMVRVGVRAVPIVCLVLFCIGAILALQMAPPLREFGKVAAVADVIAVSIFREIGPLVSAIVLTGFAGASIAAELGTMVVSEEIEAMESLAIPPTRFLVLPRVLATTVMMICLAVVGDLLGSIGGLVVSATILGIDPELYVSRTFDMLKLKDFLTGLVKAGVFGCIISLMACHLGLRVSGGAQGVGVATTRTVVLTIVALIFVDLLFTAAFYFVNL